MDLESPEAMVAGVSTAIGNTLSKFAEQLTPFRIGLKFVRLGADLAGGWIDSLLHRDAGERTLRGSLIGLDFVSAGGLLFVLCGTFRQLPDPVTIVAIIWAVGLRWADWLAAMDRRQREREEGYTFSRFIGWTRFRPAESGASYWQQAAIVILIGAALFFLGSRPGGVFLGIAGCSVLAQLWVIRAERREDAMDALDAEWLADRRNQAVQAIGGGDQGRADAAMARGISTADFIRRWSI